MSRKKTVPAYVFDGFCHRPSQDWRDGWMEDQVDEYDYPAVQQAQQIIDMFNEINRLRKENWELKRKCEMLDGILYGKG